MTTSQVCQYAEAQSIAGIEPRELIMYSINKHGIVLPKWEYGLQKELNRLKDEFIRYVLRMVREVPFCPHANKFVDCYVVLDGRICLDDSDGYETKPTLMVPKFWCRFCYANI